MNKKNLIGASALLATGLLAGGLFSVTTSANAADTNSTTTDTNATAPSFGNGQGRPAEAPVTGDNLTKLTDAALAKYPGATVIRAEEDGDGVSTYEVHLKTADGSMVTVEFDANFNITGTHDGPDFGKGGPKGGPMGGPMGDPFGSQSVNPNEKLVDSDVAAKLTAAAEAKVAGATVIRAETDADGASYEVHMKKADGSVVTVKFDADYNVTEVIDGFGVGGPKGDRGPGGHGGKGGADQPFTLPAPAPTTGTNG